MYRGDRYRGGGAGAGLQDGDVQVVAEPDHGGGRGRDRGHARALAADGGGLCGARGARAYPVSIHTINLTKLLHLDIIIVVICSDIHDVAAVVPVPAMAGE